MKIYVQIVVKRMMNSKRHLGAENFDRDKMQKWYKRILSCASLQNSSSLLLTLHLYMDSLMCSMNASFFKYNEWDNGKNRNLGYKRKMFWISYHPLKNLNKNSWLKYYQLIILLFSRSLVWKTLNNKKHKIDHFSYSKNSLFISISF